MRVCEELYSGLEKVVLNGGKSKWSAVERGLRQGCSLSPLPFNIYLMGMAEELVIAQLGKLCGCWCRVSGFHPGFFNWGSTKSRQPDPLPNHYAGKEFDQTLSWRSD